MGEFVSCTTCSGNGSLAGQPVRCDRCAGSGKVPERCSNCSGSGSVKCAACAGAGFLARWWGGKKTCENCAGKGTIGCRGCAGRGEISKKCPHCDGKGSTAGSRIPCVACGATGKIPNPSAGNAQGYAARSSPVLIRETTAGDAVTATRTLECETRARRTVRLVRRRPAKSPWRIQRRWNRTVRTSRHSPTDVPNRSEAPGPGGGA
jgi:DnaJ-class molecular chaperone